MVAFVKRLRLLGTLISCVVRKDRYSAMQDRYYDNLNNRRYIPIADFTLITVPGNWVNWIPSNYIFGLCAFHLRTLYFPQHLFHSAPFYRIYLTTSPDLSYVYTENTATFTFGSILRLPLASYSSLLYRPSRTTGQKYSQIFCFS